MDYYASITRECIDCGGTGLSGNAVCVTYSGSKIIGPITEKLVLKECVEFLENIPELRNNPDLESWKLRNSDRIALLKDDNSKFATSITEQLSKNRFLTPRQLECFYSTYQPVSPAGPEGTLTVLEHSFSIGDVLSIDIIFTEVRAAFSKTSEAYFFTFTGKTRNDGFAITASVQNHLLLGTKYHLSGKVRGIHFFDSEPYALLTVFKLTAMAGS
ncbi:hypothetical protein QPK13_23220 [Photorhabdus tasmaniensis]